jgi:hypothetical protein
MFDPLTTIGGLLGMLIEIVSTTVNAFFLPVAQLVVYPLLAILQWLS